MEILQHQLIWVSTNLTIDVKENPADRKSIIWWPAIKYSTQDDLFQMDPVVRDNIELKHCIFLSNLENISKGQAHHPVARLLGTDPPCPVLWLIPDRSVTQELTFLDHYVRLSSKQSFVHNSSLQNLQSSFTSALAEAHELMKVIKPARASSSSFYPTLQSPPESSLSTTSTSASSELQPIELRADYNSSESTHSGKFVTNLAVITYPATGIADTATQTNPPADAATSTLKEEPAKDAAFIQAATNNHSDLIQEPPQPQLSVTSKKKRGRPKTNYQIINPAQKKQAQTKQIEKKPFPVEAQLAPKTSTRTSRTKKVQVTSDNLQTDQGKAGTPPPVQIIREAPTEERMEASPDSALTEDNEDDISVFVDANGSKNTKGREIMEENEHKPTNTRPPKGKKVPRQNQVSPERTVVVEKKSSTGRKITKFLQVKDKKKQKQTRTSPESVQTELSSTNISFSYGWNILSKSNLGFSYRRHFGYLLPMASLIPETSWKENIHYFKDSSELRKSLCRDGIPILVDGPDNARKLPRRARRDEESTLQEHVSKVLSAQNIEKLQRWVSLAHIPQEYNKPHFQGVPSLTDVEAFALLKNCGYKWQNNRYNIPNVSMSSLEGLSLHMLRSHVCRYGIMGNVDAMSLEERVRVILWSSCEPFYHQIFKLVYKNKLFTGFESPSKATEEFEVLFGNIQTLSNESPTSVNSDLSLQNFDFFYGWNILSKSQLGFIHREEFGYMLPTTSLIPQSSWKENIHYFKEGMELRKSLCQNGIPIIVDAKNDASKLSRRSRRAEDLTLAEHLKNVLSTKNIEKLQRWVTLAHIPQRYNKSDFKGIGSLNDVGAFLLLKKCGYKWSGSYYIVPNETLSASSLEGLSIAQLRSHVCQHGILGSVDALELAEQVRVILWASCEPYDHEIFKLVKKEDGFSNNEDTIESMIIAEKAAEELSEANNAPSVVLVDVLDNVPNNGNNYGSGSTLEDSTNFEDKALQSFFNDKDTMSVQTFDYDDEENSGTTKKNDFRDIAEKIHATFDSIRDDSWVVLRKKLTAIGKNRHLGLYGSIWCLPGRKNYLQGSPGVDFIKDGYDLKLFAVTFLGWAGDENFWIEKEERSKIKPGGVTDKESSPTERSQRTSKRKYDDKSPASQERIHQVQKVAKQRPLATCDPSFHFNRTAEDILKACKDKLTENALSKEYWMIPSKGDVETKYDYVAETRNFVLSSIESKGRTGSLYLCGRPGTGKTTTIEMLLLEGREWALANAENCPEMFEPIPKTVYVNIPSMDCKNDHSQWPSNHNGVWCFRIFSQVSSNLGLSAASDVKAIEDRLRAPQKPKQKQKLRYFILVLDEIDLILNSKSAVDGEFLLHTLFRWSSDPNIAFTLIGISNNTDSKSLKRLTELGKKGQGKHPQTVVFSPYNHEQLKRILTLRVGDHVFDNAALELMARRIAATSGDARGILEMAIKAIDHCHESNSEADRKAIVVPPGDLFSDTSTSTRSFPLVKVNHVMQVVRDSNPKLIESIQGQPRAAQVTLCVALTLSRHMSADTVITLSSLLEYTRAASRFGLLEAPSSSDFSDIVKNLSDAGLLRIGDDPSQCFSYDASRAPIRLGVQLEDVESAMGETIYAQPFYAKIRDNLNESFK